MNDDHFSSHPHKQKCLLCGSATLFLFMHRPHVPLLMNVLLPTQDQAVRFPRGELAIVMCEACGFVFNQAFDATHVIYNEDYSNTQIHASTFKEYLHQRVRSLVEDKQVKHTSLVEVGCGDGWFLSQLVEAGENIGYGFDPSYSGPLHLMNGRLQFARRFFDTCDAALSAQVVICRHVVEHVPDPLGFLHLLRATLVHTPQARIFLETPSLEWILTNHVIWDFYYEHCSYFSAQTLAWACERSGFTVEKVEHVFAGQYLWLEARVSDRQRTSLPPADSLLQQARAFSVHETTLIQNWRQVLQKSSQNGPVALLGAAGKGVTLANLIDPDRSLISCVADVNPEKQGGFLPGTGHPIVGYEMLHTYQIVTAFCMNPSYTADCEILCQKYSLNLRLLDETSFEGVLEQDTSNDVHTLAKQLASERHAGRRIVLTNGVFDLLHIGHLLFLQQAKLLGEVLVVAINSDRSTEKVKGRGRPIHQEQDRLALVSALSCVDHVLLFDEDAPTEVIRALQPDIYTKGGDYLDQPLPGADLVRADGGQVIIIPSFGTLHTSHLLAKIHALAPSSPRTSLPEKGDDSFPIPS